MISAAGVAPTTRDRTAEIRTAFDRLAPSRNDWMQRNAYYYSDDRRYMRFLVPENAHVLELGCGTGSLLAALKPQRGLGVDISPAMIDVAQASYPELEFKVGDIEDPELMSELGGPYDVNILSDIVGYLDDVQRTLENLHGLCHAGTRVVVAYFSQFWRPMLSLAGLVKQRMPQPSQNWLSAEDIDGLLALSDYQPVKREWRLLVPRRAGGIGPILNRYVGTLPVMRRFSLRHYVVARSLRGRPDSTSRGPAKVLRSDSGRQSRVCPRHPARISHG